jgi:hypothetical protein
VALILGSFHNKRKHASRFIEEDNAASFWGVDRTYVSNCVQFGLLLLAHIEVRYVIRLQVHHVNDYIVTKKPLGTTRLC